MRQPASAPEAVTAASQEAAAQEAAAMVQRAVQEATQAAEQLAVQGATPSAMYQAARATRRELIRQRDDAQQVRSELGENLRALEGLPAAEAASRPGIEARLQQVDARLLNLDQQIAAADLRVAQTAGLPGSTIEPPRSGLPDEVIAIPIVFTVLVLFPLAIAYARRLWKRPVAAVAPVPNELREQIRELSTAVEAIGLEVERIGEGQRYVTRVLGEGPARVPVPAARQYDAAR